MIATSVCSTLSAGDRSLALGLLSAGLFLHAVLRLSLAESGLDDGGVADCCAALVLLFGRGDRAFRIEEHRATYLVDLVLEADRAEGERRFRVHMHLGDFALRMAGILPDYIAARRARKGGPPLDHCQQVGSGALPGGGRVPRAALRTGLRLSCTVPEAAPIS